MIKLTVLAIAVSLLLSGKGVEAAITKEIGYPVQKAWFDRDYIYVMFDQVTDTVKYSRRNVDGKIIKQDTRRYLVKYKKDALGSSNTLSLAMTRRADKTMYADSHFVIQQDNDHVVISGSKFSASAPTCDDAMWFDDAVTHGEYLFYCGMLIGTSGKTMLQISNGVQKEIDAAAPRVKKENPLFTDIKRKLVPAFYNDKLLATFGKKVVESDLRIFSIGLDSKEQVQRNAVSLPHSDTGYLLLNGMSAYSPYQYFVYREAVTNSNEVFFCSSSGCQRVLLPSPYSWLLVDGQNQKYYLILQKKQNVPSVEIRESTF